MLVLLLLETAELVLGKRRRRRHGNKDRSYIATTVLWVFGLVFVPLLLYFIYTMVTDPAFPDLVKLAGAALKRRWTSFLSSGKSKQHRHKKKRRTRTEQVVIVQDNSKHED